MFMRLGKNYMKIFCIIYYEFYFTSMKLVKTINKLKYKERTRHKQLTLQN